MLKGCVVNTVANGYEATHSEYPGAVGKGRSPEDAIENLDKIKGRRKGPRKEAIEGEPGVGESGEGE